MQCGAARTLALLAFLFGCGSGKEFESDPPFEDKEDVAIWATAASAVGVYVHGYEPFGLADGEVTYADPECPVTSDDGTTLSIAGGCTDVDGREWNGFLTVRRDGDDRMLSFHGFDGKNGTMQLRRLGPSEREFDADLVIGGVTTISYSGRVVGDYVGATTWNGSGRVERHGFLPPSGVVQATTEDEVVDDRCGGQPFSGTTTLRASGDTAVVTYDGATDCDDEQNALLSVNGEDRGLVSGVNCAVASTGRKVPSGVACALVGLVALFVLRRRRR